ncbi:MAG TPA: amidase family protein [Steroidobacteraceae bacterium]|nr:amidase family protein [Steroidobacteraceae bacterium]
MIDRRTLLTGLVSAAAATLARGTARRAELDEYDATGLAQLVRKGEITPLELVERAIRRIEALNPKLNAIVSDSFELARRRAREPVRQRVFEGVPYVIKDTQEFAGLPCTKSSRALAQRVPTQSLPFIDAVEATGAIPLGIANAPEYALAATTEPLLYGPCHNPWDLERSAGGSSGGSAVAVASGMTPLATASDGGGSIRIPASNCGLFGFKNSRALDIGSEDELLSVRGCLSRSVRDAAAFLVATEVAEPVDMPRVDLVEGPDKRRLRIAFTTRNTFGEEPHPEVAKATRATAALLARLGHHVTEEWLPQDGAQLAHHFMTFWGLDATSRRDFARKVLGREPEDSLFEPWTLGLMRLFKEQRNYASVELAYEYFRVCQLALRRFLQKYDVYVTPVLASPPIPLGEQAPDVEFDTLQRRIVRYVSYTPPANIAGLPSMSVPLYWTAEDLPVGTLFTAGFGKDARLLALAYELEAALPWKSRWPRESS